MRKLREIGYPVKLVGI